jgi:glyoxylase I family protein
MNEFPGVTNLAVTVSDLTRSVPWYTALFGAEPVLDEDVPAGGFHHVVYTVAGGQQLFGLHQHHPR